MCSRVEHGQNVMWQEGFAMAHDFASRGLRTLSLSYRVQTIEEFELYRQVSFVFAPRLQGA